MWVGGVALSKIAFFDPDFTFRCPKMGQNPGVGVWVHPFRINVLKKHVFLGGSPWNPSTLKYNALSIWLCLRF